MWRCKLKKSIPGRGHCESEGLKAGPSSSAGCKRWRVGSSLSFPGVTRQKSQVVKALEFQAEDMGIEGPKAKRQNQPQPCQGDTHTALLLSHPRFERAAGGAGPSWGPCATGGVGEAQEERVVSQVSFASHSTPR